MTTKTADEILRRYKRGDKQFKQVTIQAGNFSKQRLPDIVLEGAVLTGCNFEKSYFTFRFFVNA